MSDYNFEEVEPVYSNMGFREGGTQVTISYTGLITFGSGLYEGLGLDSSKGYPVDILEDFSQGVLQITFDKGHSEFGTRKDRKMNCLPKLNGLKNKTIIKLLGQVHYHKDDPTKEVSSYDKDGRVKVPSLKCKDTVLDRDNKSVIVKVPKTLKKVT